MKEHIKKTKLINLHISVDCVVIGFDNEELKVLLVKQIGTFTNDKYNNMKLPGSPIYEDEDLDEAAERVLYELTGLKNVSLFQFRAFGSKERTNNPKDILWLEEFHHLNKKIGRMVTIAYISMVKINKKLRQLSNQYDACWIELKDIGELAFDHNQIINESLEYIRQYINLNPSILFDLLPKKFTASQLRILYERIYNKVYDVRNFHKKINMMEYVVPLEEHEMGVAHRAARYYKFDRKIYNKMR